MNNHQHNESTKQNIRILKLLSKNPQAAFGYDVKDKNVSIRFNQRDYAFNHAQIIYLHTQNYILMTKTHLRLTNEGMVYLQRKLNPDCIADGIHRNLQTVKVKMDSQDRPVVKNMNESPLLRLFTRKTKTGETYLSAEEFQAGERLRKDFERGQLQPKISASLQGSIGNAKNAQACGGSDISDFAIDARKRVNRAINKLGPELSGVTLDICCFLKGLEIVERERRWPPRSAKLMLKTALSLLAKHYGITGYQNEHNKKSSFWASPDYRPSLSY